MPAPKRLTIEISSELQLKLQTILPHNTKPTRKELFTSLIEMVLEGVEAHGQQFIFDILSRDITFSPLLTQEQKNTIGVNELVKELL